MTTAKCDLHTIEYSVQGWDTIMNADMEKIDALMPTRMIGVLGETVAAYKALFHSEDTGKWELAKADGTLQPCLALAVEGGDLDDEVRLHRVGEIENEAWAWTPGLPVFLDGTTAGELTQTRPAAYTQLIGFATEPTVIYFFPQILEIAVRGSYGGLVRKAVEKLVTITASSRIACGISIPSRCRLLGAEFKVTTALVAGQLWNAAYNGGSVTQLVTDGAVALDTPYGILHKEEITKHPTDIIITRNNGSAFTAQGAIRVIAYYEELGTMASMPTMTSTSTTTTTSTSTSTTTSTTAP